MERNETNSRLYSDRHIRRLIGKRTAFDLQRIYNESLEISKHEIRKTVCNYSEEQTNVSEETIFSCQDCTSISTSTPVPLEDIVLVINTVHNNECKDSLLCTVDASEDTLSSHNTILSNKFVNKDECGTSDVESNDMEHNDRFVENIITWIKQCKPPGKSVNLLLQILREKTYKCSFPERL